MHSEELRVEIRDSLFRNDFSFREINYLHSSHFQLTRISGIATGTSRMMNDHVGRGLYREIVSW